MQENIQTPEVVTGLPLFSSAGATAAPSAETVLAQPSAGNVRNQVRMLIVKGRLPGGGNHGRRGLALVGRIRSIRT